jgi:phosphoribosyl-ATP pyrophosphohydrolase/phosphoribosyl-AMP cyclohydrolase
MKGESSGNRLRVISAFTDCDRDSLLLHVQVEGAGVVCHEGTRSCFTKEIAFQDVDSQRSKSAKGGAASQSAEEAAP